jgi:hypothetical protein
MSDRFAIELTQSRVAMVLGQMLEGDRRRSVHDLLQGVTQTFDLLVSQRGDVLAHADTGNLALGVVSLRA